MDKNCLILENIKKICIVFVDETSLWWLKLLKKGYRHCYVLFMLDDGLTWIEVNPMSNQIFLNVYKFLYEEDYIEILKKKSGTKICDVDINFVGLKVAPFGIFSCVELVKRIVGIHDFFIFTPYQLYKKLKIVGKKS